MSETPEIVERPRNRLCYRHPDRRGGVTCQRCDRTICPGCMHQASVGFHCPECVMGPRRSGDGQSPAVASSGGSSPAEASRGGPAGEPIITATRMLMGLNVLAFVFSVAVARSPGGLTSLDQRVLTAGGLFARLRIVEGDVVSLAGVGAGEYYRLVTAAFLHNGLFHLAFNMYALWLLGQLLEAGFGRLRLLSLYVVSMLGGSLGVLLISPEQPTVGASGAVFGLMGAMVLVQRAVGGNLWHSGLGTLLIINLALTVLVPRVSIGGHFGGLIAGAAMGAIMLAFERRDVPARVTVAMGGMLSVVLVAGSVALAAIP